MKPIRHPATLLTLAFLAGLSLLTAPSAHAQNNYQGRLTDAAGTTLPDGQYTITFTLWTAASGGSQLWSLFIADGGVATGHGPLVDVVGGVNPNGGRFNVIIGGTDTTGASLTTDMAASASPFLQIQVSPNAAISLRQQIFATPRALRADVIPNVTPNGSNVGIGTAPNAKLHANVNSADAIAGLRVQVDSNSKLTVGSNGGTSIGTFNDTPPANGLYVSGNVGIGTPTPTRGKQEVVGMISTTYNIGGFLNRSGASDLTNTDITRDVSIYATGIVVATEMHANSDARIKNIQGRSGGAVDLATLTRIEITDYTRKDVIAKDSRLHKKVIAQQVETVYPQAVSQSTDVVPDIYQKANVRDGGVALATDLKAGERVRLIGEKKEAIHEVLEVREGAFRSAFQPATDAVFVYGREVKDFRSVDYEAIAMLNVSATQELARKLAARSAESTQLRAEKVTLAKEVAALAARDRARDARLTRLEAALEARPTRAVSASLDLK